MSKRAEYSPGPWTLHEYEDDGVHLADVFDTYQECKTACLNIADARLIAAAPDLLEALEQAVTSMQDSGYPNSHLAVRAAREAIAKATGADHEHI